MVNYNAVHADDSADHFIGQPPTKKRTSPWIRIGLPVLVAILVIVGAVLGGVLGSRAARDNDNSSSSSSSGGDGDTAPSDPSAIASVKNDIGLFPTSSNTEFSIPLYPSTTNGAAFSTPTLNSKLAWPKDTFAPSSPAPTSVRQDRPRLFAPKQKWDALPDFIKQDPYMKSWDKTIQDYANSLLDQGPVAYYMDGDSGILDISREVKQRVKALSYTYRMTTDTKFVDRVYLELQVRLLRIFPSLFSSF